jgi:hypothetical protein
MKTTFFNSWARPQSRQRAGDSVKITFSYCLRWINAREKHRFCADKQLIWLIFTVFTCSVSLKQKRPYLLLMS